MKTYKKVCSVIAWAVLIIAVWQTAAYIMASVLNDPMAGKKLPMIYDVLVSFAQNRQELLRQAGITVSYAAAGFLIGTAVGVVLAVIMSLSVCCEKTLQPYLLISQMIPVLGLAPIMFGLFKDIAVTRVVIAAYITFFPVAINLLSGLKSADKNLLTMMRAGAASKPQLYIKLLFPHSLPYLFTALKIAAPMAVTASILVDTLSAKDGIGYIIILTLYGGGTTGQFWPAVIISALLGLISLLIISAAEVIAVPWKRHRREAAV